MADTRNAREDIEPEEEATASSFCAPQNQMRSSDSLPTTSTWHPPPPLEVLDYPRDCCHPEKAECHSSESMELKHFATQQVVHPSADDKPVTDYDPLIETSKSCGSSPTEALGNIGSRSTVVQQVF